MLASYVYPLYLRYLVSIPLKHHTQHSLVYTIDYQKHLMQANFFPTHAGSLIFSK